jgi:hypothetical protein
VIDRPTLVTITLTSPSTKSQNTTKNCEFGRHLHRQLGDFLERLRIKLLTTRTIISNNNPWEAIGIEDSRDPPDGDIVGGGVKLRVSAIRLPSS